VTIGTSGAARATLFGALGLLLALSACSSPDPVLYTIAPVSGSAVAAGPSLILLDRIDIPRYLDRSQIVRSSENYRLDVIANDWWGEPLGPMLRRILRQELTQRLPQSSVISESAVTSASPDATIDLDLQRLDEDASGNLILQAQAGVSFKGRKAPVLRSFNVRVPVSAPTSGAEVAAVSAAVGQLADGLAAMLVGR
jgi:uncharacterized lipoprotein YmbA